MKKTMALVMALAFAAPIAAIAATPQNTQPTSNFSKGRQAPVLSDGSMTGYNSFTAS